MQWGYNNKRAGMPSSSPPKIVSAAQRGTRRAALLRPGRALLGETPHCL